MAKKLCELCQQNFESDMRFGVRLCQECLDGYSAAMRGDLDAVTQFSNPQNFLKATDLAKKTIIYAIAKRCKRTEEIEQETQQANQQKKEIEEKEQQREAYANAVGLTYKEKVDTAESTVDSWYTDIGKKIKGWARTIFIVEAIMFVVGAIIMLFSAENGGEILTAIITAIIGPIIAWVSSWILYAFGELVDKTVANERNTQNILKLMLENKAKDNQG